MINLVKKENLNLSILETDFDVFSDIVNTFSSEVLKKECLLDLDDYIIPEYFKNKITLVVQSNDMLIGYATFEFKNGSEISNVEINKLYVLEQFREKNMEVLLIEGIAYIAGEVGSKNVVVTVDEHDAYLLTMYQKVGFHEVGMNEDGNLLSLNVTSCVELRKLNDKFRDIPSDYIDYKSLKLVKKIASGRSGNIYLTSDNRILKMFTSTSFTHIKDREETLKHIKKLDIPEVVKPKHLVYYDGVFVGYIMDYLPDGDSLWANLENYSFEEKIDIIKELEKVMKKLHEKKIYICDLNPDNIFIDKDGKIKLIDCDSFVVKESIVNKAIENKYIDPYYKVVSEKTDLYAYAVTALQLLLNKNIQKDASYLEVAKVFNKNKSKLPDSFKNYYNHVFNDNERYYLTEAYERYIDEMYSDDDIDVVSSRNGKISIIILSIMLLTITMIGFLLLRK